MGNYFSYDEMHSVYPGEYTPLPELEAIQEELKKKRKGKVAKPLVNFREQPTGFELEVALPGVKRENLMIVASENILSIGLLHKNPETCKEESFKMHEFNYECCDRHILLPSNADVAFACAEFKDGILHLYIPKTETPVKNELQRIVVY